MQASTLSLLDASIVDLQTALSIGLVTCVDLVTAYLHRISTYDCRGTSLNSIPIINPHVFNEAAASDERRTNGTVLGPLDGIPFTVKDSYKVKGLTVASGSPAFQDLIASKDAYTVQSLRDAGAVLIGKTNMCPMAAGGMQRGVYGRAESPYNSDYLAAAFASGSSNGSGVATAASFAAFGMGEETVSSGRSPASNNALVAYTPSRGVISIRGNWPLYPTCDVVVPHTRSVKDLLAVLDVVTTEDKTKQGDFWRDQSFVELPKLEKRSSRSFCELAKSMSLEGIRIAVPSMYIGGKQGKGCIPVTTSPEVVALYQTAKSDLEALGATVVEVDEFPVIGTYEMANASPTRLPGPNSLPGGWNTVERSIMIAYAWEQFLYENNNVNIHSLEQVDHRQIYPAYPPDDPQLRYTETANMIHYAKLPSFINVAKVAQKEDDFDSRATLMAIPNLEAALLALESMRKLYYEDWLATSCFDFVAFPACGDVGKSDADVDYESAEYAWKNGVKYSNGNRALRHLGIPTVTVPMGNMEQKGMPVGLTVLAKAGEDMRLLELAYTYEQATKRRTAPRLTPPLGVGKDVFISADLQRQGPRRPRPELKIEKCISTPSSPVGKNMQRVSIHGCVTYAKPTSPISPEPLNLSIFIDAQPVPKERLVIEQCHGMMCGRPVFDFRCSVIVPEPPQRSDKDRVSSRRKIARDSTMVVVTAREGKDGRAGGWLKML